MIAVSYCFIGTIGNSKEDCSYPKDGVLADAQESSPWVPVRDISVLGRRSFVLYRNRQNRVLQSMPAAVLSAQGEETQFNFV